MNNSNSTTRRPYRSRSASTSSSARNGRPKYFSPNHNSGGRNFNSNNKKQNRGRKQSVFNVARYIQDNPVLNQAPEPVEEYVTKHKFSDFDLVRSLSAVIQRSHYKTPSPIQDQIIPYILEGKDVIGLANTGTGKTAAFLIPLINKALKNTNESIMILAPTRELVLQIEKELQSLTRGLRIFSVICVGGVNISGQIRSLRRHQHFIIGTPGRTKDLIQRKCIRPEKIQTVVLDEVDQMLDMGFIADMRSILSQLPKKHQTLFFSATLSKDLEKIAHDFLVHPERVTVKKQETSANVKQEIIRVGGKDKISVLADLLQKEEFSKVLVFGRTKYGVEKLSKKLIQRGIKAASIHGNKSHGQRQNALRSFKESRINVLVATDVAARGIHINNVSHVINFDLPATQEDYTHRIGRTGRVDKQGIAISFV